MTTLVLFLQMNKWNSCSKRPCIKWLYPYWLIVKSTANLHQLFLSLSLSLSLSFPLYIWPLIRSMYRSIAVADQSVNLYESNTIPIPIPIPTVPVYLTTVLQFIWKFGRARTLSYIKSSFLFQILTLLFKILSIIFPHFIGIFLFFIDWCLL